MEVVGSEQAELLIARCSFSDAAARLAGDRLVAVVYALAGDDANLAAAIAPQLVGARNAAGAASHFQALESPPDSTDYLCAAVVLSWSSEPSAVFDLFREAYDRAVDEKRFHFAVGARERLAHHAVLFGEVDIAKAALEDAMRLAGAQRLFKWQLRAAAAAARLAFDSGEPERAIQLAARARAHAHGPEEIALLAAAGAGVAVASGDEASLREWTSSEISGVALRSTVRESAIAATIALLAPAETAPDKVAAIALRRCILGQPRRDRRGRAALACGPLRRGRGCAPCRRCSRRVCRAEP